MTSACARPCGPPRPRPHSRHGRRRSRSTSKRPSMAKSQGLCARFYANCRRSGQKPRRTSPMCGGPRRRTQSRHAENAPGKSEAVSQFSCSREGSSASVTQMETLMIRKRARISLRRGRIRNRIVRVGFRHCGSDQMLERCRRRLVLLLTLLSSALNPHSHPGDPNDPQSRRILAAIAVVAAVEAPGVGSGKRRTETCYSCTGGWCCY